MSTPATSKQLGSVLVVGGCGFLGHHIVRLLLQDSECTSISVVSRNPTQDRLPNVSYHAADITDFSAISTLLAKVQPHVIIHTASPSAFSNPSVFHRINVGGTANLLACAAQAPSVVALVYCSSTTVMAGIEHIGAKENDPIFEHSSKVNLYSKSKAIADTLVLEANNPTASDGKNLRTLCIRPPAIYGEKDTLVIPETLNQLWNKQTRFQLGANTNRFDWIYVENVASAHILGAKALLAAATEPKTPKVDGEAFFVTDDAPLLFWDFLRKVWAAAGDQTPLQEVWVIPAWLALRIAAVVEWVFWILTQGQKQPTKFTRQKMEYCCFERTYCIDKAKERLGYVPLISTDEGIRRAVKWTLEQGRAEGNKKDIGKKTK